MSGEEEKASNLIMQTRNVKNLFKLLSFTLAIIKRNVRGGKEKFFVDTNASERFCDCY